MYIFQIVESIVFGVAGVIVVWWLSEYVFELFRVIKFVLSMRCGLEAFDADFFLENFIENCDVVILTEKYDHVDLMKFDDYRFVIALKSSEQPSRNKTIFHPLPYAVFKDLYRTVSSQIIIDDNFYLLRFGDSFQIDTTEKLTQEVYGNDRY